MKSKRKRSQKRTLFQRPDGDLCVGCVERFPIEELTLDHLKPRSKGGTSSLDNLRLMCWSCNQAKADTWSEGWL